MGAGTAGKPGEGLGTTWGYDLSAWDADSRDALDSMLGAAWIPRDWRDSILVVPGDRRARVESLMALASSVEATEAADTKGGAADPAVDAATSPGWQPDPWGEAPWRWWDGTSWTGFVSAPMEKARPWFPPRGDQERGVAGFGIALVGYVVAVGFSFGFVGLGSAFGVSTTGLAALCLSQAGLWTGLLGACIVAVHRRRGSLRDLGLTRLRWRDLGSGALVAFVGRLGSGAIIAVVLALLGDEPARRTTSIPTRVDRDALVMATVAAIVVIGAPFFEELFFRGLVQGALTYRMGSRAALYVQAVLFALVHLTLGMNLAQALITFFMILLVGVLLGAMRWHYQRLGPSMAAHALFNSVAVIVIFTV